MPCIFEQLLCIRYSCRIVERIRFISSKLIDLPDDRILVVSIGNGGFIHGYGIQSIRRIMERAQGRCKFVPQDEKFLAEIVLLYAKDTFSSRV